MNKKSILFLTSIFLCFIIFSCAKKYETKEDILSYSLESPPEYNAGDRWNYTNGLFREIIKTTTDEILSKSNFSPHYQDCVNFIDREGTLLKVNDKTGRIIENYPGIGLRVLAFPLTIGKEWDQKITLLTQKSAKKRDFLFHFKITAYERVKVKAGSFMAFKINWKSESLTTSWKGDLDMWWAPEVKNYIKRKVKKGSQRNYELISYKLN